MITTNRIAPLDTVTPQSQPCDVCLLAKQPHSVSIVSVSSTKSDAATTFYDADATAHTHNWDQQHIKYRCSNGHEWAERFIIECPSCGWTVDNQGDATP